MDAKNSEFVRKKYLYRELILKRKIGLNPKSASKLIGPDCAYHLYSKIEFNAKIQKEPE